ncbi:hypothetical protein J2W36_003008 [Variovorax ginsengisoli]|uniref:Uncharacterized protein n=1 Tax=Variovorax ginsengisoli TaxID=363844 RepID=A0ABT9SBK4_9BURK|nr:hypothetical protein [Variovorax ginsengisoli]
MPSVDATPIFGLIGPTQLPSSTVALLSNIDHGQSPRVG